MSSMKYGLMLPLAESETPGYATLREMAITAEAHGLDSVWGADHLIFREDGETEGIHECWTLLTAIAAVTTRVEIGPLVLALPFRNPALTAKMAAELDEVSDGRLILGLGCGWHQPEFDAFGYPFDHRVGRFEEGLEIIMPLLRGETVSFEGRYFRVKDVELRPRPIRPGGPPVLIAGKQPRMLSLVARHAAQWNGAWYGNPGQADELRTRLANVRAALDSAARDPATLGLRMPRPMRPSAPSAARPTTWPTRWPDTQSSASSTSSRTSSRARPMRSAAMPRRRRSPANASRRRSADPARGLDPGLR
jgi:alkanesulfonate monooxygenase SsuD/methylene tetrahydromethanopterin reductase-like flavin-dependent oxidoreductase (luciferase family)